MSFARKSQDKKRLLGLVIRKRDGAPVENAALYAIAENVNQLLIWHRTYAPPKNSEPQLLYTDDEGRFELDNLVPGFRYKLTLEQSQGQSTDCFEFTAQAGKQIDLGVANPR